VGVEFVLTTALDPLPHLYTVYSDKLESEDCLSVPANSNDETDQATSGLSESDSSRSGAQGSTCEGSQHSYVVFKSPVARTGKNCNQTGLQPVATRPAVAVL